MKKIITFITAFLLSLSILSAASWTESMQRSGTIQGAYGSVMKVVFTQIATQSSSFSVGMPFDIEGRLVQYSKTEDGRLISYWSVISNTKFKLNISAGKLTSVKEDDDHKHTELDYILKFTYDLGYKDVGGVQKSLSGSFSYNTDTGKCEYVGADGTQNTTTDGSVDIIPTTANESIIGSVEGSVYFMFTSESTDKIEKKGDSVLSGDYTATVTVKIISTGA